MDVPNADANNTLMLCSFRYRNFVAPDGELWCSWAWDSILCWPPTRASSTSSQRCPLVNGIDTTKFVERRCEDNGRWQEREDDHEGGRTTPNGWTNYTPCFTPEMLLLFRQLNAGSEDAAKVKMDIAEKTRTLEIVGLSVSLAALLVSLAIFYRFRSLRNTRTRIHKNLFIAMVIEVVIRLTLYIDQALWRSSPLNAHRGIENTPFLCEASYVMLEYARTAMFMWMFIEGLFLHNMLTVAVFQETSCYWTYHMIGWGYPVLMTLAWAIVTARYFHPIKCWWGYNLTIYFWILEGPRLAVILLNFLFLLNIIRVLVMKLRQSRTSEIEQVRKAVRAAVVLLPLLGITNLVSMAKAPLDKEVWEFAMWSYLTHFLTSFQGLFIATIYCFFNGEVRLALDKTISVYLSRRGLHPQNKRQSTFSACQPRRITSVIEMEEEKLRPSGRVRLCCRGCNASIPDRLAETTI